MAEKPILFNGEMVRAILDGRKTQTRRPIKAAPAHVHSPDGAAGVYYPTRPKYRQGDLLYVRESYAPNYFGYGEHGYRADWTGEAADVCDEPKWTPSIHMRKQDALIWLRVTDVRLERVQDISEEDARAEGIQRHAMGWTDGANGYDVMTARDAFAELWDDVYPGSWDRDDWVWVYEFERDGAPNA